MALPSALTSADVNAAGGDPLARALINAVGRNFEERMIREADNWNASAFATGVAVAAGTQNTALSAVGITLPLIAKTVFVTEISVSIESTSATPANEIVVQLSATTAAGGTWNPFVAQFVKRAGQSIATQYPRQLVRGYQLLSPALGMAIRNASGTDTVDVAVKMSGYRLTDDLHWGALKTMMFAGDSLLNGLAGNLTQTSDCWAFILKAALQSAYDIRLLLKSVSGSNTSNHEQYRANGFHDVFDVSLGGYAVSVNDAIQGVTPAAALANMQKYATWFHNRYPAAKLIVFGTTPLGTPAAETNAVAIRAAYSSWIASSGYPSWLGYVELGDAFPATDSTYYAEASGSGVHPIVKGHAAIAAVAIPRVQALISGWGGI